jgi:hypothetical protein
MTRIRQSLRRGGCRPHISVIAGRRPMAHLLYQRSTARCEFEGYQSTLSEIVLKKLRCFLDSGSLNMSDAEESVVWLLVAIGRRRLFRLQQIP